MSFYPERLAFGLVLCCLLVITAVRQGNQETEKMNRLEQLVHHGRYYELVTRLNRDMRHSGSCKKYLLRATALNKLERYESALADCDRAIALNPHEPAVWIERARAQIGLGRFAQAEDDSNWARFLSPDNDEAGDLVAQALTLKQKGTPEFIPMTDI